MKAAAVILAVMAVAALILYIHDRLTRPAATHSETDDASARDAAASGSSGVAASGTLGVASGSSGADAGSSGADAADALVADAANASEPHDPEVCCGMHAVCEKYPADIDTIIYYDDEELDIFAGRDPEAYSEAEVEQFRDVLLTLLPADRAPWAYSLEQRRIALPASLRDELMLMLSEP